MVRREGADGILRDERLIAPAVDSPLLIRFSDGEQGSACTHACPSSAWGGRATDEQAAAAMAALWERYKGAMTARVLAIETATNHLLEGFLTEGERSSAHSEAHKLAGSIGTFGYLEASRLAREVEEILGKRGPLGEKDAARLSGLAGRLRSEVDEAAQNPPRDVF